MPSLSENTLPQFFRREIYLGEDERLPLEFMALPMEGATGLLLRETRELQMASNSLPVLTRAFEHIATVLRYELTYLKQVSGPLRFFHVQYAMSAHNGPQWKAQEVLLTLKDDHYLYGKWVPVPADCAFEVNAALSSGEPPKRRFP